MEQFPDFAEQNNVTLRKALADYRLGDTSGAYVTFQTILESEKGGKLAVGSGILDDLSGAGTGQA